MSKRHFLVTLHERNGEYEYTHRCLISVDGQPSVDSPEVKDAAEYEARTWYGGIPDADDGGYYFHCGCVFVEVDGIRPLTKHQFKILKKFL